MHFARRPLVLHPGSSAGGAERRRRPHEEAPSFWGWHFLACPCAAYSCWRFGSAASRRPASQTVIMWTTTSGQSAYTKLQRAMDQPVAATAKRTASEECVSAARHTPSARTALTARQATIPKRASAYPVTIVIGTGRRWIVKGTTQFSGGPKCNVIQQTAPATANSVGVARDVSIRIHRPPRLFLLRPPPCLRRRLRLRHQLIRRNRRHRLPPRRSRQALHLALPTHRSPPQGVAHGVPRPTCRQPLPRHIWMLGVWHGWRTSIARVSSATAAACSGAP